MKYCWPVIVLATCGTSMNVWAQSAPTLADRVIPGLRQGQIHNPFSPRYAPLVPNSYASRHVQVQSDSTHVNQSSGVVLPTYSWWSGYHGQGYPVDDYYYPEPQPPVLYGFSPIVIPTESLYGPAAAARVLGNLTPDPAPVNNVWVDAADRWNGAAERGPAWDELPAEPAPPVRSNPQRVARAIRSIGFGDELFRQQRYGEAYRRYKQAAEAAPDHADAYFRQAIVLIALAQYDTACEAIRRGFEHDTEWDSSPFRLDDVYGANALAKRAHRDALAEAAEASPQDGRLWYLLGVALYFDGEPLRAEPFFERAQQLVGHNVYLHGFLRAIEALHEAEQEEAETL